MIDEILKFVGKMDRFVLRFLQKVGRAIQSIFFYADNFVVSRLFLLGGCTLFVFKAILESRKGNYGEATIRVVVIVITFGIVWSYISMARESTLFAKSNECGKTGLVKVLRRIGAIWVLFGFYSIVYLAMVGEQVSSAKILQVVETLSWTLMLYFLSTCPLWRPSRRKRTSQQPGHVV